MLLLLKEGNRAKEVQASPMRGNERENTTRGNRESKGRETGRFRRGNKQSEGWGAFVTVSFDSSVTVSPTAREGKQAKRLPETGNTEEGTTPEAKMGKREVRKEG